MYDFSESIRNNNLHHAFIIEGAYSIDKFNYAKNIAKQILCIEKPGVGCNLCSVCKKITSDNHIDITVIEATAEKGFKTKSIKNDDIENLQQRLNQKPLEGERNIAIIKDADLITLRGYNRLLKTIEEPPEGTVIMLLSENINKLPQTIVSRCVHVRINEKISNVKQVPEAIEIFDLIIGNAPFYKQKQMVEKFVKDNEKALLLLDILEYNFRDLLLETCQKRRYRKTKEYIFNAIDCIEDARKEININVNMQYVIKKMILKILG